MSESLEENSGALSAYQAFGGWLRFYQVINIVGVVIFSTVAVFTVYSFCTLDFTRQDYIDFLSIFIESTPGLIASIITVRKITKKEESTPTLMNSILAYYTFSAVIIYIILIVIFSNGLISEKPSSIFGSVIYFLLWRAYFKKSKRVATYYGKNAI